VPAFAAELFEDAYRKGLVFVYALQKRGWGEVEKLYSEYPPASTEQILHPEKWFSREAPVRVKWPAFEVLPLFADWEVVYRNVLGEAQWRLVFREHGLGADATGAASGWAGDDYVVLKRKADDALLLLWHTSWDTVADAVEFASVYRRLLEVKYSDAPSPTRLRQNDRNVFVVEGADDASIDVFLDFVSSQRAELQPVPELHAAGHPR
jgi:hypothetical protein